MWLRPESRMRGSGGSERVEGCREIWDYSWGGKKRSRVSLSASPSPKPHLSPSRSQAQAMCRSRRPPPASAICGVGNASRGAPSPHHPQPHPRCPQGRVSTRFGVRPPPGCACRLPIPASPPGARSCAPHPTVSHRTRSPPCRGPRTPYPSAERGEQAGEEERGAHGGAGHSPAAGPELK